MNDNQQLDSQTTELILKEIRTGRFKNVSVLPTEVDLATLFNVSRTTIRESLASLENEGFISRKRRIGTIVNKHVLNVKTRLDLEREFLDMIREAGYEAHADTILSEFSTASEEEAHVLHIEPGDPILHVIKVAYADDTPTIYCIDAIPGNLIQMGNYNSGDFSVPIFDFIEKNCLATSHMALSEIHAENVSKEIGEHLNIPVGSAVIHLKEVEYDFLGIPLLYSSEYYREGVLTHTILRRKIN